MREQSPEAKARFDRWHLRQRELGACRCHECREVYPEKPAQPPVTLVGMEGMSAGEAAAEAEYQASVAERVLETLDGQRIANRDFIGPPAPPVVGHRGGFEFTEPAPRVGVVRLIEDTVAPNLISEEQAQQNARLQRAIEENLRKEQEQHQFREMIAKEPLERPVLRALEAWEQRMQAAKAGGTYGPSPAAIDQAHARLNERCKELDARSADLSYARGEAQRERQQANDARLTYEQARARLEREFGSETVAKAISSLEKLLTIRQDLDQLEEWADEAHDDLSTLNSAAEELDDDIGAIRGKLKTLKSKLDD
jgi:type II secretory pathway component PulJ